MKPSHSGSLRVGIARREISPLKPMFLIGYPHVPRTSTGVHDPLWATATSFQSREQAVLMVALDVLYVPAEMTRQCRVAIQRATGIPPKNILISATHTHSAPTTVHLLMWEHDPVVPMPDPEYMEFFSQQVVAAATAAHASAVAAEVAVVRGVVDGVGGNRLWKGGIMDREFGAFYARRREDERPLALAMIYGMHPTVLHEDSTLASSDFPHFTRQQIEEDLSGVVVGYHNGPCGNLSLRHDVSGQTFAEAERLGRKLGQAVVAAAKGARASDFVDDLVLDGQQSFVNLPVRPIPSLKQAEEDFRGAVTEYERLKREGAGHGPVRTAECVTFGAEEAVALSRAKESGRLAEWLKQYLPAEVQMLRIGDTRVVGLPCEIFVEYGLEIKQRSPHPSLVISMANGQLEGYIVTPEAAVTGGYEAAFSTFSPAAGQILVNAALELCRDEKNSR